MTKNTTHQELLHATLLLSMLFRIFVIVIIVFFVLQRSGDIASALIAGFGAALFVCADIYLTLREVFHKKTERHLQLIYALVKILLILIVLLYALRIWLSFEYWAYPSFAIFVAVLYGLDFLLVSHMKKGARSV